MKKITLLIAVIIAGISLNAQDGVLDYTFGSFGLTMTDINASDNQARNIIIQPDDKIIVGGYSTNLSNQDFALARYNVNGLLDNTFGTAGIVVTNVSGGDDVIRGMALQTDGKIVVVGYSGVDNEYLTIARYDSNGTLDNGFATNGIDSLLIYDNPGSDRTVPNDVKIQADGKIVVVGFTKNSGGDLNPMVVRYNSNGTLDGSFGIGGKVVTSLGPGEAQWEQVAIQTNGKLVVTGYYNSAGPNNVIATARYDQLGGLDNSFGTNGIRSFAQGPSGNNEANSIAIQNDGKIVIGGITPNGNDADFLLLRYDQFGLLDNSFGTGGVVTTELGNNVDDYLLQVLIQPDGKILACGATFRFTIDQTIVRYNSNGTLDNSFGASSNGIMIGGYVSADEIAFGIALQSNDKIIITGKFNDDFFVNRYTNTIVGIEDNAELNSFNIYPNPVKDRLFINSKTEKINSIKIIDVTGKATKIFNQNIKTINVADLPKGLYLLQIQTEKGKEVKRFIKE